MDFFQKGIDIISGDLNHIDYNRVIEVADYGFKIMTGKDQGDLITMYKQRETEEQKKRRVELTNSLTPLGS